MPTPPQLQAPCRFLATPPVFHFQFSIRLACCFGPWTLPLTLQSSALGVQVLSSVLFLSEAGEAACWGPTVVVDQTPRSALGRRAWLAPAICNCLVSFPGSLLHGVLPGALASGQLRVVGLLFGSLVHDPAESTKRSSRRAAS